MVMRVPERIILLETRGFSKLLLKLCRLDLPFGLFSTGMLNVAVDFSPSQYYHHDWLLVVVVVHVYQCGLHHELKSTP